MKILSIDTSCDDVAAAVIVDGNIFSNVLFSQIAYHKEWGGVVPFLARRLHQEKIDGVIAHALKQAHLSIEEMDYIAATQGPGLAVALEVGLAKGKELAQLYHKPFIPVNHMEGHLYSPFARNKRGKGNIQTLSFPYLGVLVSGNHTELVLMHNHSTYEKIGEKLDDAAGEAFDKVGRMLGLGYPGGPIIALLAKQGNPQRYPLPVPMKHAKSYDFSYSGLKTAVARVISQHQPLDKQTICDIAASFQQAAAEEILTNVDRALQNYSVRGVLFGGGVSANIYLRTHLRAVCRKYDIPLHLPPNKKLCTDNAGMIGICAYWKVISENFTEQPLDTIDRDPKLSL